MTKPDSSLLCSCCFSRMCQDHVITMTSQWTGWRLKSSASRLFTQPFIRAQIKENIKARVTCLCAWNSPVTGEFPAQIASNAETVSIWRRHHGLSVPMLKWKWFREKIKLMEEVDYAITDNVETTSHQLPRNGPSYRRRVLHEQTRGWTTWWHLCGVSICVEYWSIRFCGSVS